MTTIRAVAFDAFGTLINYGAAHYRPYHRLMRRDGPPRTEQRHAFMTRNISAAAFAAAQGLEAVLPEFSRELTAELADLHLFPDAEIVLQRVRDKGLRAVVCSNLAYEYGDVVRRLAPGLDGYVLSYEVGLAKPDPAIYAEVCRVVDCAPAEVFFVGDTEDCDCTAPQQFGMQAAWLNRKAGETLLTALGSIL